MAFAANEVFRRASIILQDVTFTRWPLPEMLDWLNDCLREITILAPAIVSQTVVANLNQGTVQSNPCRGAQILRANCNVTGDPPSYTRGRVVTPIRKAILDAQIPGWQDHACMPFDTNVLHFVEDDALHDKFLVAPGNNGLGKIELVVAQCPPPIQLPDDPEDIDSYDQARTPVAISTIYLSACVDYVIYRALLKDVAILNGPERAIGHYQQFAAALGHKVMNERAFNPTTDKPAQGIAG